MRILYFDCSMGAAGDMLSAALLELLPDPDEFVKELNALSIPGVCYKRERSVKCGITGTHLSVTVHGKQEESKDFGQAPFHDHGTHPDHSHSHGTHPDHSHSHRGLHDIAHIVRDHLLLPEKIKDDIMAVYELIAKAESRVHGVSVSDIHFHEVGSMDAVADITAFCMLLNRLKPDEIVVSPVHVGSGQVSCAHGILPVPAPATADILKDVPIYGGTIQGELCTPTGAALLKHFATRFDAMPAMRTQAIGYGMGKKDFEAANCVRAMLGEFGEAEGLADEILELSCNVDDMTGEAIGFAMDRLLEEGALDVYTVPVGMKKSRPGILLHVMCRESDRNALVRAIFLYTTTIGIRENRMRRFVLKRHLETVKTSCGAVRCKHSAGYGAERKKYEYDDLIRIAKENNIGITDAALLIDAAIRKSSGN